ncbi:WD40 repeat domain-containing protein, partial [Salmonella sp. s54412]|uniref:WD40 repeat domain-containing protein n=1 Tax=Salmonella sp. s54412 TaxID=3160128 RepID=UPI003754A561
GIGQADKEVVVYSTTDHKEVSSTWITHSSRITSLSWTSDSLHLASGSLDSNVAVWTIGKRDNVFIKAAHRLSVVTGVAWLNDNQLVTTAHDCSIKIWDIVHA